MPLGELAEGEQLCGASGPAIVLTATILTRSLPVYNIEVHGEHVYQVGTRGLLVHNACAPKSALDDVAGQISGPGQRLAGQIETIANMRPFVDRMQDAMANPGKWKVIRSVTEPSSAVHNRGGTSLQELLWNEETGETIVRHTLFRKNGSIFDPAHFRDIWK